MLSIGKLGIGQERYYLDKVAEGAEDYYSGEGEAAGRMARRRRRGPRPRRRGRRRPAHRDADRPQPGRRRAAAGLQRRRRPRARSPASTSPSRPRSRSPCSGRSADPAPRRGQRRPPRAPSAPPSTTCSARPAGRGGERAAGVRPGQRLPRRRLPPPLLARRRPPAPHPRPDRQRDQGPDGRWTRLYHPAIYDHAKTAGYIYEAHLRHELTRRLGVEWQPVRNGIAEIEGFADEHLRAFSTRRAEILEAAGPDASARSMQVATLATRKAKEPRPDRGDPARALARRRAEEIGLDRETIERTFGHERESRRRRRARTASTGRSTARSRRRPPTSTAATRSRPSPTRCPTARRQPRSSASPTPSSPPSR